MLAGPLADTCFLHPASGEKREECNTHETRAIEHGNSLVGHARRGATISLVPAPKTLTAPPKRRPDLRLDTDRGTVVNGRVVTTFAPVLLMLAGACSSRALGPGVDARERDLSGQDLSHADLSGANLAAARMAGCELAGAKLSRAHLSWADLERADLAGADLSWSSLEHADLREAKLAGAKLEQALFGGAHLCGADLTGVNDVTALQLSRAHCWDERTRLPAGLVLLPTVQPH